MIRRAAVALVTLAVLIVASAGHAGAATAPSGAAAVQRVLVISLPATSWSDIEAGDDPHLKQLLSQSAIADMITRAAGRKNSIAGGYTALGAGGRASAVTPLAPQAFEPSEPYGESTAGDVYRQRTGVTATSGLVHLGIDALVQENADGLYDPTIGALGDDLAKHRVPRAVIANGDGAQPVVDEPLPEFQRAAVNALMGSDGRVPGGAVGDELLEPDPHAPFGVRTDNDAAYRAFSDAWRTGGVVLVEGSDLLRADLYTEFLTDDQARVQKQAALHRTDELVGRMLADVDSAHDAVFVVSPASPRRGSGLAVSGIRAPGVEPELLRSATSRRDGFVYVIDIAPTILDLLGYPTPSTMEGRTMEVVSGGVAHGERTDALIRANEDAVFRDSKVATANNIVLGLAAAPRWRHGSCSDAAPGGAPARRASWRSGCWDSSSPPTSPGRCTSAAAATRRRTSASSRPGRWRSRSRLVAGRRRRGTSRSRSPWRPPSPSTSATCSPAPGWSSTPCSGTRRRWASGCRGRATSRSRSSPRRRCCSGGWRCGAALAARRSTGSSRCSPSPSWSWRRHRGAVDLGAAIAGAPAFGLFAWLLLGRRIRLRTVVILGAVLVVAGLLVGFADLLRPKDQQTHVGRFFDKVATGGLGDFFLTIRRKATENIDSFSSTRLLWVLPIVALLVWFLWRVHGGRVRPLFREVPVIRQTMLALVVVAVLGYALNDSGIAIPALMAVVFECALVYVALVPAREPVADPPGPAPVAPYPPAPDEPRAREPQLV